MTLVNKSRFPAKSVFGHGFTNQSFKLPVDNREFHNMSSQLFHQGRSVNRYKSSVKVYDDDNRMHWMNSSIDLSQPEIKRFKFENSSNDLNDSSSMSNYQFHAKFSESKKQLDPNSSYHFSSKHRPDNDFRRSNKTGESIINSKVSGNLLSKSTNVKKVSPNDLPKFESPTINKKPKFLNVSRRFTKQPDSSLKQKYYEKIAYIDSPLNQVKVPGMSSSKVDF